MDYGGLAMDNQYGLTTSRVTHEHHDGMIKSSQKPALACNACGYDKLTLCQTMHDHKCEQCGAWQNDIHLSYATGRSANY